MSFNELLTASKMSLAQFTRYFDIPYRTAQNWKEELSRCPVYLLELMKYKLEKENII